MQSFDRRPREGPHRARDRRARRRVRRGGGRLDAAPALAQHIEGCGGAYASRAVQPAALRRPLPHGAPDAEKSRPPPGRGGGAHSRERRSARSQNRDWTVLLRLVRRACYGHVPRLENIHRPRKPRLGAAWHDASDRVRSVTQKNGPRNRPPAHRHDAAPPLRHDRLGRARLPEKHRRAAGLLALRRKARLQRHGLRPHAHERRDAQNHTEILRAVAALHGQARN